ncbi:hypothetical protein CCZ01_09735, partial [Helicobacter monodelphidis]|uniref:hypothetical protein n=1 Tax=Helicobacter sp. 15-1451 TaxID=2004995 RepID=UPI000DCAFCFB
TKESTNWLENDSIQKIKTPLKEGLGILSLISPQKAENKEPQETEAEKIARITKHINEKFNPNKIKRNNITEEQVAEALRRNEIVFDENGEVIDGFIRNPKRDWFLYRHLGNPFAVELNKAGLTEEARAASKHYETLSHDETFPIFASYIFQRLSQSKAMTGSYEHVFSNAIPTFNSTTKKGIMDEFFKMIDKSIQMRIDNKQGHSAEAVKEKVETLTGLKDAVKEVYSKNA